MEFSGYKNLPDALSNDEINELFLEFHNGSREARDRLITCNIRLVMHVINTKFYNLNYEYEDLVSLGTIGLTRAVDTYDVNKGINFSTYAVRCIYNEILKDIRSSKKNVNTLSWEELIFNTKHGDNDITLEDTLYDTNSDFVTEYENKELNKFIKDYIYNLGDRDKKIMLLFFGIDGRKRYEQREIAEMVGICQPQVSKLITKNLKYLKFKLLELNYIDLCDMEINEKSETIYEYFNNYSSEQVDEIINKLSAFDKYILSLKYGNNLRSNVTARMTEDDKKLFYGYLIPKIEKKIKVKKKDNR